MTFSWRLKRTDVSLGGNLFEPLGLEGVGLIGPLKINTTPIIYAAALAIKAGCVLIVSWFVASLISCFTADST